MSSDGLLRGVWFYGVTTCYGMLFFTYCGFFGFLWPASAFLFFCFFFFPAVLLLVILVAGYCWLILVAG